MDKTAYDASSVSNTAGFQYNDKSRLLVTITSIDTGVRVQGVIPEDYHFTAKNEYAPLLSPSTANANLVKGTSFLSQLNVPIMNEISMVPFSPQIWMGADPLTISELTLHFVCHTDPKKDVHYPLMTLLSMGLPRQGHGADEVLDKLSLSEFSKTFPNMGMLQHPPAIEVVIGDVIQWSPCYIQNIQVTEKAPYSPEGYGFIGEAKLNIIRRDYVYGDGFGTTNKNGLNATGRQVTANPAGTEPKKP